MQGIVSILRSDNTGTATRAASLRRTLSADMSSKNWLAENVLPMMKKIASSEQIAVDSSSSSESDEEECEDRNPRRIDIWTAIMSQKKQDNSGNLPPPYVHPLVKKSASSLSEKSLKVCTESLGSETGSDVSLESETRSDVFVSHLSQSSETETGEEHKVVKLACLSTKKSQQCRSFPPPLPSLAAAHTDGPSLHVHSHRVDGRLVLEAVSVPQQKYFEAQRQDGRFLLTLIDNPEHQPSENNFSGENSDKNIKDDQNNNNGNDKKNEDENKKDFRRPVNPIGILINLHKSPAKRGNENPWFSQKLDVKSLPPRPPRANGLPPLAPPPPPTTAISVVNSYQYFWRAKPTVASVIDPMITQHRPPTKTKDVVLLRGNKADCSFIPSLKFCKEPRRSFVLWEPFCIATS